MADRTDNIAMCGETKKHVKVRSDRPHGCTMEYQPAVGRLDTPGYEEKESGLPKICTKSTMVHPLESFPEIGLGAGGD